MSSSLTTPYTISATHHQPSKTNQTRLARQTRPLQHCLFGRCPGYRPTFHTNRKCVGSTFRVWWRTQYCCRPRLDLELPVLRLGKVLQ